MRRRSKILCTLGPATSTPEQIGALIDAGMDAVRLNFSHGEHSDHAKLFHTVRSEAEKRKRSIAILLDLQGPKIRVGKFKEGEATLEKGEKFIITTDTSVLGNKERVSTSYQALPRDLKEGDQILLDDGYLSLRVTHTTEREVHTLVEDGGILRDRKGINVPNAKLSAPALTAKDKADLAFGLSLGVEYIALSFVRAPEDVLEAKRLATADNHRIPVIAKIEKPQAVDRLEEIVQVSDGIMVARGDLGVELGPSKVPLIQKEIIEKTNARGKIVIVATQMLESMIKNPRPTRAEASDVANAVLDGTDALMLSGETAIGAHPQCTVKTMASIIQEVDSTGVVGLTGEHPTLSLKVSANAIAHAAVIAARQMNIKTIVVVTDSGGAARLMSEYRPEANIIALTTKEVTFRRLALYWGVTPIMMGPSMTTDELFSNVEEILLDRGFASSNEYVVISLATPVGGGLTTNTLKIHKMR